MSYVVIIRVQVEGDREEYKSLIDNFRLECLEQDEGMEQFMVCSGPDDEQAFLVVQTFISEEAHYQHMHSVIVRYYRLGSPKSPKCYV